MQTLELYEIEINKWKRAYEQVVRENEQLRTQANDSMLVRKWQERYEECLKEKEDLISKLKVFSRYSDSHGNKWPSPLSPGGTLTSLTSNEGKKSLEQLYIDLKDEYKVMITINLLCKCTFTYFYMLFSTLYQASLFDSISFYCIYSIEV